MRIKLFSNFAWIDAKYIRSETKAFEGNKVELVPNITNKWGLSFRQKQFKAGIQWSYTSGQYSDATNAATSPNAVEGWIPAYHILDFSLSYAWKFLRLEGCV